jgi:hypothetical protein
MGKVKMLFTDPGGMKMDSVVREYFDSDVEIFKIELSRFNDYTIDLNGTNFIEITFTNFDNDIFHKLISDNDILQIEDDNDPHSDFIKEYVGGIFSVRECKYQLSKSSMTMKNNKLMLVLRKLSKSDEAFMSIYHLREGSLDSQQLLDMITNIRWDKSRIFDWLDRNESKVHDNHKDILQDILLLKKLTE